MDPRFVYEVRFIGPDESIAYSRLFYQLQIAREYIHKLVEFDTKRSQKPVANFRKKQYYFLTGEVSLYRIPVSDSIHEHPTPTRLLIYETSPEDQYLFEYLQTKYKERYIADYEIKSNIKVQIELFEEIKPLIVELFGRDLSTTIIEYIKIPINLDTLDEQLKRLADSDALNVVDFKAHGGYHVSYSALM